MIRITRRGRNLSPRAARSARPRSSNAKSPRSSDSQSSRGRGANSTMSAICRSKLAAGLTDAVQASGRSGAPTVSARFRYEGCRRRGARSLAVSRRSLGGGSSCPASDQKPLAEDECIVSPHRYALNAISDDPTMEFLGATRLSRNYFITRSLARPNIGAKSAIAFDPWIRGRLRGQEEIYCAAIGCLWQRSKERMARA
jgi:hypothetical protein